MKLKLSVKLIIIILVVSTVALIYLSRPTPTGNYDEFAKCLTQKGAVMYGGYKCYFCNSQKEMFGDSFKYVTYVECDSNGPNANPALCQEKQISSFPTWIYNQNTKIGMQTLLTLSLWTGCSLPQA